MTQIVNIAEVLKNRSLQVNKSKNEENSKENTLKSTAYEWQNRALDIAKDLGITKGIVFRYTKKNRSKVEAVYNYMSGKKFTNPTGYFLKLMSL